MTTYGKLGLTAGKPNWYYQAQTTTGVGTYKRDKDDIRLLTQLVTGHVNLKYHRFEEDLKTTQTVNTAVNDRQQYTYLQNAQGT